MFRTDRRIYPGQGRMRRSHRGDFLEDEGLEDQNIYGKNLFASSANGYSPRQFAGGKISKWPQGYVIGNHPLWELFQNWVPDNQGPL